MRLQDIIAADAAYVSRTHSVNVSTVFGWVEIRPHDRREGDIFLQGDDASVFISEGERLWNELGDVTHSEVWDHLARPYVECLS